MGRSACSGEADTLCMIPVFECVLPAHNERSSLISPARLPSKTCLCPRSTIMSSCAYTCQTHNALYFHIHGKSVKTWSGTETERRERECEYLKPVCVKCGWVQLVSTFPRMWEENKDASSVQIRNGHKTNTRRNLMTWISRPSSRFIDIIFFCGHVSRNKRTCRAFILLLSSNAFHGLFAEFCRNWYLTTAFTFAEERFVE